MPNGETSLIQSLLESDLVQSMIALVPAGILALIGATFDYFYSIKKGRRVWSLLGYLVHLGFAVFVGYCAGLMVMGFGYPVEAAGAVAGGAGWANTKLIDLFVIWWGVKYGRLSDASK